MKRHFITFMSPGTFVPEQTRKPIGSWDVEVGIRMSKEITERHNSKPYGFYFTTRERGVDDFDSKQTQISPMYFLGGKIETVDEIEARGLAGEKILLSNMKGNGYDRVIVNTNSWQITLPLNADDVVLEV